MNQKLNLVSCKERKLSKKLKEISPIRKCNWRGSEEEEEEEYGVDGKKGVTPLYLVTTNSRSLCSSPDSWELFGLEDLEMLRRKVKEVEVRVQENLERMKEKLDENEDLNKYVEVLEEKLKRRHRNSVLDQSCKEVLCESRCLII